MPSTPPPPGSPRSPGPPGRKRPSATPPPPLDTGWRSAAAWYDGLVGDAGSEYQQRVVFPGVMKLLHLSEGERVLDIGCGTGALCRLMRDKGCKVTGVDLAPDMIEHAKGHGEEGIAYHTADARDLLACDALKGKKFSAIACVLAIQDLDPIEPVFQGVAQLLSERGRFVLAMMHPCFRPPKSSSWGFDEKARLQYRRVDRYLEPRQEKIVTHPGQDNEAFTWTFHRPLQSYVAALASAGLAVHALEEWVSHKKSDSGPRAAAENRARKEFPLFLALRAIKPR